VRVKINGQWWTITEDSDDRGSYGVCTFADRSIQLWPGLRGQRRLRTLIHETLHALDWSMPHPRVEKFERTIAKILWRDGWRRDGK